MTWCAEESNKFQVEQTHLNPSDRDIGIVINLGCFVLERTAAQSSVSMPRVSFYRFVVTLRRSSVKSRISLCVHATHMKKKCQLYRVRLNPFRCSDCYWNRKQHHTCMVTRNPCQQAISLALFLNVKTSPWLGDRNSGTRILIMMKGIAITLNTPKNTWQYWQLCIMQKSW